MAESTSHSGLEFEVVEDRPGRSMVTARCGCGWSRTSTGWSATGIIDEQLRPAHAAHADDLASATSPGVADSAEPESRSDGPQDNSDKLALILLAVNTVLAFAFALWASINEPEHKVLLFFVILILTELLLCIFVLPFANLAKPAEMRRAEAAARKAASKPPVSGDLVPLRRWTGRSYMTRNAVV